MKIHRNQKGITSIQKVNCTSGTIAPTNNSKKIYCEELIIHPIRVNISYASLATTTDKPQDT